MIGSYDITLRKTVQDASQGIFALVHFVVDLPNFGLDNKSIISSID
jgi:hypothetical protein